ncbi:hypothetical protein Tco_0178937, partial [Tanacetum coccineum]
DFLRDSNLRYVLTYNPTIYDSLVKQFWQTATANTIANGTLEINAAIDTIGYTITEASIRDKLQLEDATGITMLPNDAIFEGIGQMGYPTDGTFTFWKSFFTPQSRYLVHHLLHCISSKSGGWDQFGSNIATALICLSTDRVYNFSKLIFDGMMANLKSKTKFLMYPCFLQLILDIQTENKHPYLAVTLTKNIFGNMKRGFRGAPRPLLPAMLLVATTNPNAGQEHHAVAQSQPSSSTLTVPSTSSPPVQSPPPIPASIPTPTPIPETEPEPFKHTFEEPSPVHQHFSPPQEQAQGQKTVDDLLQVIPQLISRIDSLETDLKQTKLTMRNAIVKTEAQGWLSQDDPLDSSVQGLVTPSSTKPRSIDKGRKIQEEESRLRAKEVVSSLDFQEEVDTGAEQVNTAQGVSSGCLNLVLAVNMLKSKEQVLQKEASLAEAIRLDTLQKEEVAKQEVNYKEKILQRYLVGFVNQRKKYFAEERARAKRNKPMTQSQLKTYMMNYMKNQGTWKLSQLKNLSFEEVKKEFDKLVKTTKTPKRLKDDEDVEAKDDEPTKKSGKRRKQMARKLDCIQVLIRMTLKVQMKIVNKMILSQEVDIIKKTENQAKMTKLSMEWKRLCKIKAKVQKCQSQSHTRRISSQTGAGTEEYY